MLFDFIPADSYAEASSRIFALSGHKPQHSRGPKRALVALARAVGVDVDLVRTNDVLAQDIAAALSVTLPLGAVTTTGQVSLDGVNSLLLGAVERFAGAPPPAPQGVATAGAVRGFTPARSKLEAVNRISALTTSGPQYLGPGGKERKSVLVNLARAVFPELDTTINKVDLAAQVAGLLAVPWTEDCSSTGYTITLPGLNTILAGAERLLRSQGRAAGTFASPVDEAAALVVALKDELPEHWDGRECVQEMREDGSNQWRQTEWPGWYFEHRGLVALNDTFAMLEVGGAERRFGSTVFDYALGWVWDLKTHTQTKRHWPSGKVEKAPTSLVLNDADAARACIEAQGLGFLVLSGDAHYDDDLAFDDWHRSFTRRDGPDVTRSNTGVSRRRKAAFHVNEIEAVRLDSVSSLDAALAAGAFAVRPQGRQQARPGQVEGSARNDKLHMDLAKAGDLVVAWDGWHQAAEHRPGPG